MSDRLPVALEASALIRQIQSAGGFATVIAKGEPDAGTLLLVTVENGRGGRIWERMPHPDGTRIWTCTRVEDPENSQVFNDYLARRRAQDADLWIVELDIANPERFIAESGNQG
jgi:hypothetical protein